MVFDAQIPLCLARGLRPGRCFKPHGAVFVVNLSEDVVLCCLPTGSAAVLLAAARRDGRRSPRGMQPRFPQGWWSCSGYIASTGTGGCPRGGPWGYAQGSPRLGPGCSLLTYTLRRRAVCLDLLPPAAWCFRCGTTKTTAARGDELFKTTTRPATGSGPRGHRGYKLARPWRRLLPLVPLVPLVLRQPPGLFLLLPGFPGLRVDRVPGPAPTRRSEANLRMSECGQDLHPQHASDRVREGGGGKKKKNE